MKTSPNVSVKNGRDGTIFLGEIARNRVCKRSPEGSDPLTIVISPTDFVLRYASLTFFENCLC
jgi:hypothetical protein